MLEFAFASFLPTRPLGPTDNRELLLMVLTRLPLPLSASLSFFSNLTQAKSSHPAPSIHAAMMKIVGAYVPTVAAKTVP